MSANAKEVVVLLNVVDLQASLGFYVDVLGFKKTLEWSPEGRLRWCRLELDDIALMLQEYLPGKAPSGRGLGVSLCLQCEDALAIYRDAKARGGAPKKPFVGNGLWVVMFEDPDGYRLEFASPTDAPEETEYEGA
jgi:catechol 2,3-dioxygenase-like lactoylglutathione lyase family enzyme